MPTPSREVRLIRRPVGMPVDDDFELARVLLPDPGPGQVLVRTIAMSVDPYMRGRMNAGPSYAPAWQLGEPMQGATVGVVHASGDPALPPGTTVVHGFGWREYAVLDAGSVRAVPEAPGLPLTYHLGVLGMPGLTAWAGLFRVADLQPGDTVFVSGAAGAVGSLVGQFARLRGAGRVIGSAGGPDKVRYLTAELGFDAAFDYRDGPVADSLAAAAPDGIDVYFDNVGGEQLQAAIGALTVHGRAALCGSISNYNATEPAPGPNNLGLLVGKRLRLQGFLVGDHQDLQPEFVQTVGQWLRSGELVARETVVDGLDRAVEAFRGLLQGANTGKMVVRVAADGEAAGAGSSTA